jgi:Alpha/beta hydrolase domain
MKIFSARVATAVAAWAMTLSATGLGSAAVGAPPGEPGFDQAAYGQHGKATTGITRIDITSSTVAFGGRTFGTYGMVGTYQKLRGKAYGELDPNDPRNRVITDLQLAPRNAKGMVEYSTDIYILKPTDLRKGNHQLFMEVNNRGSKLFAGLNGSPFTNDPTTAADAGQAFLMNQGYTLVWSGWDPQALPVDDGLTIQVPVAKNRDGSSITGPNYEYIEFDNPTTTTAALSYNAATRDRAKAVLTVRDHLTDTPRTVPASGWEYASPNSLRLLPAGTAFKQGAIYEFTYTAKDPLVAGIGFAATRDVVSFLRHDRADSFGKRNPLAGDMTRAFAYAVSQPARYLNDFVWLGFNQDRRGGKVFDGIENWIGGGTGVGLNYRFAQPQRTERIRQHHLYPEAPFPFSYKTLRDPATGKTDGRDRRCRMTGTCPKIISLNSSNEYWSKAASLLHTDLSGHDTHGPGNVRYYLLSSVEHTVVAEPPNSPGPCAQPRNTIDPTSVERALFVALVRWVNAGDQPPASRVPRVADGTLVRVRPTRNSGLGIGVVPQEELGWPSIPGVTYTGTATIRNRYDFGPRFPSGIIDIYPPKATGFTYRTFVPKVDADGNEIAGVRVPDVAAPIATFTGWGVRAPEFGGPDGCEGFGQTIDFAATAAERASTGDPRLSLAERYHDHAGYVAAVTTAAKELESQGFLLAQDADAYISAAETSSVLK